MFAKKERPADWLVFLKRTNKKDQPIGWSYGAGDEARTRYLHLGKVALYRMSYTRGTSSIIARIFRLSTLFHDFYMTKNKMLTSCSILPRNTKM